MQTQRSNNRSLRLVLAGMAIAVLAAVACNGDDSPPDSGSPSADTSPGATVTPGSGATPANAVGTYIDAGRLEGHQLDLSRQTECPLEPVQTVTAGTPTIISRIGLGQFCLASKDWEPDKTITLIVDLPDTGEAWEILVEFDSDVSLWNVEDVEKISG